MTAELSVGADQRCTRACPRKFVLASNMSKQNIVKLFAGLAVDERRHAVVAAMAEPRTRYIIAMTPRSGSSHLCDVLKNAKLMGRPGEMLSQLFIPNIAKSAPGRDPDEYLRQVMKATQSRTGISGLKASWFQFNDFTSAMAQPLAFKQFRFIHLTRRDLAAQAVSLYCATETNVFHTNIEHSETALGKLADLEYDFAKIKVWQEHILVQEKGWQQYFARHGIFPLAITYEDIEADVVAVARRIAAYIGRPRAAGEASAESIFRKIGERRNVEWAARFTLELDREQRAVEPAVLAGGE
jgi:LPS sulfotransferase NodH